MSSPTTDASPFCGVTLLACFVVAQPFPDRHAATNSRIGAIHFASFFISVSSRSTRTASREVASDRHAERCKLRTTPAPRRVPGLPLRLLIQTLSAIPTCLANCRFRS